MGNGTKIEWAEATWNPVAGCSLASSGCQNCYAMKFAHRFAGRGQRYEGLTELGKHGPRWTGKVRELPQRLAEPLKWKKPRRIFVNSMSDLFHADVSNEFIAAVFGVMAATPQHQFLILTKRAARLPEWFRWVDRDEQPLGELHVNIAPLLSQYTEPESYIQDEEPPVVLRNDQAMETLLDAEWPLSNVWIGVSVEDQATADERIGPLLRTPAAVRWVSYEPALACVDFSRWLCSLYIRDGYRQVLQRFPTTGATPEHLAAPGIDWLVFGGESGPGARPFDLGWGRSVLEQCKAASVPVFAKQLGARPFLRRPDVAYPIPLQFSDRKGGDIAEFPEELQVREFPR